MMMSFSYGRKLKETKKLMKKKSTLRTYKFILFPLTKTIQSYKKRISLFIALHSRNRDSVQGSMTVEASLSLPIFLFSVWILLYMIEILSIYGNMQGAIHKQAKELSKYSYVYDSLLNDKDNEVVEGIGSFIFTQAYVKNKVIEDIGEEYLDSTCIENGKDGLSFLRTSFLKDEMIDIVVTYSIKLPFQIINKSVPIAQRCRIRGFTGYDLKDKTNKDGTEEMVYVTKTGSVYHKDRNCSHIKITINQILYSEIESKRNYSGEKYYPCEICAKSKHAGLVYITEDGNRYHNSLNCSGLKRMVFEIPLSKVGNRRPCSRCGG